MKRWLTLVVPLIGLLSINASAFAIPQMINYQGILEDASGTPVTTPQQVLFAIWDAPTAGNLLWSELQTVNPDAVGRFNVLLGSVESIPATALASSAFVSMKVGTDSEMSGRTELVSVAYAYQARESAEAELAHAVSDNSISGPKVIDGTLELVDIGQNGATEGQVIKWLNGQWQPAPDEATVVFPTEPIGDFHEYGVALSAGNTTIFTSPGTRKITSIVINNWWTYTSDLNATIAVGGVPVMSSRLNRDANPFVWSADSGGGIDISAGQDVELWITVDGAPASTRVEVAIVGYEY